MARRASSKAETQLIRQHCYREFFAFNKLYIQGDAFELSSLYAFGTAGWLIDDMEGLC
jgi:hypothetical protein